MDKPSEIMPGTQNGTTRHKTGWLSLTILITCIVLLAGIYVFSLIQTVSDNTAKQVVDQAAALAADEADDQAAEDAAAVAVTAQVAADKMEYISYVPGDLQMLGSTQGAEFTIAMEEPDTDVIGILYVERIINEAGNLIEDARLAVQSDGITLYDGEITGQGMHIQFRIPKECIQKGVLKLQITPDTGSTAEPVTVSPSRLILQQPCTPDDRIHFTVDSDGCRYFESGISYIENNFVWSSGSSSRLILDMDELDADLLCSINLAMIYNGSQQLIISSGDTVLYDAVLMSAGRIAFIIPESCAVNGKLVLDFSYPGAISPVELGGEDPRIVAVAFSSIYFDKQ